MNAIARLNDEFRKTFEGGAVVLTQGVLALAPDDIIRLQNLVKAFDAFNDGNNLWGEKDFGSIELNEQKYYWKIDYYDTDLEGLSPDPANPEVTIRVMTLMHSSEY